MSKRHHPCDRCDKFLALNAEGVIRMHPRSRADKRLCSGSLQQPRNQELIGRLAYAFAVMVDAHRAIHMRLDVAACASCETYRLLATTPDVRKAEKQVIGTITTTTPNINHKETTRA